MSQTFPQPFGKYVLLNKIALGGMAEIFRAVTVGAEGFEREVVIKRILPHYTEDEAFVTMFIDEATVAAKLSHANIVQIYDFDNLNNCYYIAMEYIEGQDLKKVVDVARKKEKDLSVALCTWILIEASKGLHYAHTRKHRNKPLNIVHRDVSPHNVMVSYNGEVKIMDFGIAKAASRSTATRAGTVKGKCAYMSPEQAKGHELDGRSDLFALGVMFWEMLTGERLFAGDTDFATLSNVLKCEVAPPSTHNDKIPEELDAVILKALSAEADDRQADVGEFITDLQRFFFSIVTESVQSELTELIQELFEADIQALADLQVSETESYSSAGITDSQVARAAMAAGGTGQVGAVDNEAATMAVQSPYASGVSHTGATVAVAPRQHNKIFLIGGAVAALAFIGYMAFGGNGDDSAGKAPQGGAAQVEETVTITIVPTPDNAQVFINGEASKRKVAFPIGTELEVVLENNGTRTAPQSVTVERDGQTVDIEWKAPEAAQVNIEIQAPDDVFLRVKGKVLGQGTQTLETSLGGEFLLEAYHQHGEVYSRTVKVEREGQSIAIAGDDIPPGRTPAEITLTVTPPEATITVNDEPVKLEGGTGVLPGTFLGDVVVLLITHEGYVKATRTIHLKKEAVSLTVVLKKPGDPSLVGTGTVSINARPWADVYHKGRKLGRTPLRKKKVMAGKQKFKLKNAQGSKFITIRVPRNGHASKSVDLR
jgi:serine/threonine protein kinase